MLLAHLMAAGPPSSIVVDPEPPTVPYQHGVSPWLNPPVPISADHITTADGSVAHDTTGSYVHPSVLDFHSLTESGKWAGHRYWMANSEYSNHGREDTMILASDDGYNWHQPDGAAPGPVWRHTDQLPVRPGVNTDPELAYDSGTGELVHLWRQDNNDDGSRPTRIWHSKSTDGVAWSSPLLLFEPAKMAAISPSIVPDGTGGWWMFSWGGEQAKRTAPALTGPWSAPVAISSPSVWHGGVWRDPATGRLYGCGGAAVSGVGTFIGMVSDDDGMTWKRTASVISALTGNWDDDSLYRPTIQPHPDGKHFRLWYSIHGLPGTLNRTGYTIVPRSLWDG